MDWFSTAILFLISGAFKIIGAVLLIGITYALYRMTWHIVSFVWQLIHAESHDRFETWAKNKFNKRKK